MGKNTCLSPWCYTLVESQRKVAWLPASKYDTEFSVKYVVLFYLKFFLSPLASATHPRVRLVTHESSSSQNTCGPPWTVVPDIHCTRHFQEEFLVSTLSPRHLTGQPSGLPDASLPKPQSWQWNFITLPVLPSEDLLIVLVHIIHFSFSSATRLNC